MDFVIPLERDNLREEERKGQYVVQEDYDVSELDGKLEEFCKALDDDRCAVTQYFDVYFSCLTNFPELNFGVVHDAWSNSLNSLEGLKTEIGEYLKDVENGLQAAEAQPQRKSCLNALQMTIYILAELADACETRANATKPAIDLSLLSGPRKRGRQKSQKARSSMDEFDWDWDFEKERLLKSLLSILELNLRCLWDPPVVEEQFINAISNCCYKMLESASFVKSQFSNPIWFVLGLLIERYNHSNAAVKIVQLLQQCEHLSTELAKAVNVFIDKCNCRTIVSDICRELHRIDSDDLSREGGSAKNYVAFLTELAKLAPDPLLPCVSLLTAHLDGESYSMRIAVLTVLQILILRRMTGENMDHIKRAARDQLLDRIEEHVYDVNAFVRSKSVQLWTELFSAHAVPLPRLRTLLPRISSRLQDKAATVRQRTIQFLTALLQANPFANELNVELIYAKYNQELQVLAEMKPEAEGGEEVKAVEASWAQLEKDLSLCIDEWLTSNEEPSEEAAAEVENNISTDIVFSRIFRNVSEEYFDEACALLHAAYLKWPDHHLLKSLKPVFEEKRSRATDAKEASSRSTADSSSAYNSDADIKTEKSDGEKTDDANKNKQQQAIPGNNKEQLNKLTLEFFKKLFFELRIVESLEENAQGIVPDSQNQQQVVVSPYLRQKLFVQYLKDSLLFAETLQKSLPLVCRLLHSKTSSDVHEALTFIVASVEFRIDGSKTAFRKSLTLIWSKEQSIKEAEVKAFQRLYLTVENERSIKNRANMIAENLLGLVNGATDSELASFEQIVEELMKLKLLDHAVVKVFWERFSSISDNRCFSISLLNEAKAALKILAMAAKAERNLLLVNVEILVKHGLGKQAEADFELARDAIRTLEKLTILPKNPADRTAEPWRLQNDSELVERIKFLIVEGFKKLEDISWIPMMESALNLLFAACKNPELLLAEIINAVTKRLEEISTKLAEKEANENSGGEELCNGPIENDDTNATAVVDYNAAHLARLFSLVGHAALRMLVYLDVTVLSDLKKKNAKKAARKQMKIRQCATANKNTRRQSARFGEDACEQELGLGGASVEDAEQEYIIGLCEKEILSEDDLLGHFAPLLHLVCTRVDLFYNEELQAAANLALARFMLLSSSFCQDNLHVLFTALEKSPFAVVRANTMVVISDLCSRFPNLIEPWTGDIYAKLKDRDLTVRQNCLLVLTHLILNDMIKVKGFIADIALCTLDKDENMCAVAKTFFTELSQKGNAIYNLMPDMVSRLSDSKMDYEDFKTVMKFLFGFIQKERQCESLIEKLCQRFQAARDIEQWRMLSFCLSLTSYSEKALRKFQENTICFADKLADDVVYENFCNVLASAKRSAKPEMKALVVELEERWEKLHEEGFANSEATRRAERALEKKRKNEALAAATPSAAHRPSAAGGTTPATGRQLRLTRKANMTTTLPPFEEQSDDQDFICTPKASAASTAQAAKIGPTENDLTPPAGPDWAVSTEEEKSDDEAEELPNGLQSGSSPGSASGGRKRYRKRKQRNKRPAVADEDSEDESKRTEAVNQRTRPARGARIKKEPDFETDSAAVSTTSSQQSLLAVQLPEVVVQRLAPDVLSKYVAESSRKNEVKCAVPETQPVSCEASAKVADIANTESSLQITSSVDEVGSGQRSRPARACRIKKESIDGDASVDKSQTQSQTNAPQRVLRQHLSTEKLSKSGVSPRRSPRTVVKEEQTSSCESDFQVTPSASAGSSDTNQKRRGRPPKASPAADVGRSSEQKRVLRGKK